MRIHPTPTYLATISMAAALAALAGCGGPGGGAAPAPAKAAAAEERVDTYECRGVVRELPAPDGHEIRILHEAIPDFRGADGAVVGMGAMEMPLDLADAVSLDGIAVGDKVRFSLEVRGMRGRITAVERLPDDTVLAVPQA